MLWSVRQEPKSNTNAAQICDLAYKNLKVQGILRTKFLKEKILAIHPYSNWEISWPKYISLG